MSKNPVFEFFKRSNALRRSDPRAPRLIGGTRWRSGGSTRLPFDYHGSTFRDSTAILDTLRSWPHPNDVFVDSSFFSPARLEFNRRLLLERRVWVLPEIEKELLDLRVTTNPLVRPLQSFLFNAAGELNPRLISGTPDWLSGQLYAASRYGNLLHLRKGVLDVQTADFEKQNGRPPKGNERTKIFQDLLAKGISLRSLALANKGSRRWRNADEVLAVEGVLHPILSGRDSFILTADRDVFEQVFQFTQLLHDDYGSFLIARDFAMNPTRYPHRHAVVSKFMKPGAIEVGRQGEPEYLLPSIFRTCAVTVIDVHTKQFLVWVCLREIDQMLQFQNLSADGRVADGGDGANVHMSLCSGECRTMRPHFTVGHDEIAGEKETSVGNIRLSRWDVQRILVDRPIPTSANGRVWMPGLNRS
jgi:hypothetical protein